MTQAPLLLSVGIARAIHGQLLALHGGLSSSGDDAKLESALARVPNRIAYADEMPPLQELAAEYAFGIARDHPFADGNKRLAFMCAFVFLKINGVLLKADEVETVVVVQALAAGDIGVPELAAWLAKHSVPVKRKR